MRNVFLALLLFILALWYNAISWQKSCQRREGFDDVATMIKNLQEATNEIGDAKSYDVWLGYVYANSPKVATALNDFKRRVFQPSCKFRPNWDTQLPPGMVRPMGAQKADVANVAYKSYLDCLANNSEGCTLKLNDFRARFMEPGCLFLNPSNTDSYVKDYVAPFS